jgi:hypothetical protein
MNIQLLALAAEISGYADLGMKREAMRLTDRVLEKRRILPEEFGEALRTIGVYSSFSDFKKWKSKLEAAYNRQSRRFKRKARSDMLGMYASLREWEQHYSSSSFESSQPLPTCFSEWRCC